MLVYSIHIALVMLLSAFDTVANRKAYIKNLKRQRKEVFGEVTRVQNVNSTLERYPLSTANKAKKKLIISLALTRA